MSEVFNAFQDRASRVWCMRGAFCTFRQLAFDCGVHLELSVYFSELVHFIFSHCHPVLVALFVYLSFSCSQHAVCAQLAARRIRSHHFACYLVSRRVLLWHGSKVGLR